MGRFLLLVFAGKVRKTCRNVFFHSGTEKKKAKGYFDRLDV